MFGETRRLPLDALSRWESNPECGLAGQGCWWRDVRWPRAEEAVTCCRGLAHAGEPAWGRRPPGIGRVRGTSTSQGPSEGLWSPQSGSRWRLASCSVCLTKAFR